MSQDIFKEKERWMMLMPSIFGENLFDDFMDGFPFGGYRNTSSFNNLMKTDIRDTDQGYAGIR